MTTAGTLKVHHVVPPFPRSVKGKFHILFAHLRQLHLTTHLLLPSTPRYDVYFVDQLSTCIPFLRAIAKTRVVFYCHFPDKLLANGEFIDGQLTKKKVGLLKAIYRYPMDWLEEITTGALFSCFVIFLSSPPLLQHKLTLSSPTPNSQPVFSIHISPLKISQFLRWFTQG
jgi:hypothetical protein